MTTVLPFIGILPIGSGASHSRCFDQRRRPETFLTAIATAFFCPSKDDEPLAAGDTSVKQIALQHHLVLNGNDDSGKFRTLRFMDRHRVSEDDPIEFAERIGDGPSVESDRNRSNAGFNLTRFSIDESRRGKATKGVRRRAASQTTPS
jgi:hypothetical protein